ncbi:hypothetical protein Stsp02_30580 [Streptomyces sp. NBRC 14336]|uniref:hypothetical protein n=1 Tax=Streptomyces sp. NBRC 14336 TaxID=3030992 RepID=UPI0024A2DBFE|nr:hypothetical protein [Streptomyces sp. NBRC 14336]WBO82058.1 hypothetical protein SBE_005954 [Streptomyces sp. SBE_14.2]GLW47396.1 hypothetical protein Stsp02_30580 [Streptomyces sp. NBRC 14336]
MKIGTVLRELHDDERELIRCLLLTAERHRDAHEIHHLALDLATWSHRHLRDLADVADTYGLRLDPDPDDGPRRTDRLREKGGALIGRPTDPGMLLLNDLREICGRASAVSLDWELVAQAAQAMADERLLGLARRCHPDTLRQLRWANTELKETSPQVLTS